LKEAGNKGGGGGERRGEGTIILAVVGETLGPPQGDREGAHDPVFIIKRDALHQQAAGGHQHALPIP